MKWITLLACCMLLGCDTVFPPSAPKVIDIQAPPFNDDQDILALQIAKVVDVTPTPDGPVTPVTPTNCPKVGDTCPNCSGTGKSGDGIKPDRECGGDGIVHAADPAITECVASTPQENEHSIVKEYLLKEEFDKFFSDNEVTIDVLKTGIEMVNDKINKVTEASATATEEDTQLDQLTARVNELEAKLAALDERCTCGKQPPVAATQTEYRIDYQGFTYIWDEASRSFVGPGTRKITFPHIGPIEQQKKIKICVGEYCTEVDLQKVQKQIQSVK